MSELKPCPFCGGKPKPSWKNCELKAQKDTGEKKIKYRVQMICTKCYSRGMPYTTIMWQSDFDRNMKFYEGKAIEAWNRREKE